MNAWLKELKDHSVIFLHASMGSGNSPINLKVAICHVRAKRERGDFYDSNPVFFYVSIP